MAFSGYARSCPEFRCTSQVLRSKVPRRFFESRIRPTHPGQRHLLLADFCLLIPPADAVLLASWRVNLPR